jgi:nucleolar protein 53
MLAEAVAQEMQKVYKTELGPAPVPLTIEGDTLSEDEVSLLLVCYNIIDGKMSIEFDSLIHMAVVFTISEVLS